MGESSTGVPFIRYARRKESGAERQASRDSQSRGTAQALPGGVRQSSQQARPLTNLMTCSEEDRLVGATIEEGQPSERDEEFFTPLAIRSDEKQLKLISRNQQNGYIKLLADSGQVNLKSQTPCPAPLSSQKKHRQNKQRQPSQGKSFRGL